MSGLVQLWLSVRNDPAWLSRLIECGLSEADALTVSLLDDGLINVTNRKALAASESRAQRLVTEFAATVEIEDPAFILGARRRYLAQEIKRLEGSMQADKLAWGKEVMRAKTQDGRKFAAAMANDKDDQKRLLRLRNELARLGRNRQEGKLTDAEIQRARDYPLWRLLNNRPGQRVTCPWHEDNKKTFALYEDGKGHCFSCNKTHDAIDWLMQTEGLTFFDAVRRLA